MEITVNGQPHALDKPLTVAQLLERLGYGERRVAVEVNEAIVPRSLHASHALAGGDRIELVQAIGGG
jgi:sulfur carrier protein